LTVTRDELEPVFEERKQRYVRANRSIKDTLNDFLDDLSARYGVREGLMVVGEAKGFESFFKKATDKYDCHSVEEAFDRVRDLSRVRVICHTLDDCYRLLKMLQDQQSLYVDPSKIEDRIREPSETGYRAIHLEVLVDITVDGEQIAVPVEVQIRTILQEAWGFYTHGDFYKGTHVTSVIAKLMREFSDLLLWADKHANLLVEEVASARKEQLGAAVVSNGGDTDANTPAEAVEEEAKDDAPPEGGATPATA
jgi:ppGpp synthetase/RelA/SpoT-type nucleotidyltranferase